MALGEVPEKDKQVKTRGREIGNITKTISSIKNITTKTAL